MVCTLYAAGQAMQIYNIDQWEVPLTHSKAIHLQAVDSKALHSKAVHLGAMGL